MKAGLQVEDDGPQPPLGIGGRAGLCFERRRVPGVADKQIQKNADDPSKIICRREGILGRKRRCRASRLVEKLLKKLRAAVVAEITLLGSKGVGAAISAHVWQMHCFQLRVTAAPQSKTADAAYENIGDQDHDHREAIIPRTHVPNEATNTHQRYPKFQKANLVRDIRSDRIARLRIVPSSLPGPTTTEPARASLVPLVTRGLRLH